MLHRWNAALHCRCCDFPASPNRHQPIRPLPDNLVTCTGPVYIAKPGSICCMVATGLWHGPSCERAYPQATPNGSLHTSARGGKIKAKEAVTSTSSNTDTPKRATLFFRMGPGVNVVEPAMLLFERSAWHAHSSCAPKRASRIVTLLESRD